MKIWFCLNYLLGVILNFNKYSFLCFFVLEYIYFGSLGLNFIDYFFDIWRLIYFVKNILYYICSVLVR